MASEIGSQLRVSVIFQIVRRPVQNELAETLAIYPQTTSSNEEEHPPNTSSGQHPSQHHQIQLVYTR